MDRRQREQARLACQISIGLMAGIFSILPSASAAPVQDTTNKVVTAIGSFHVDQSAKTEKGGTLTAVTSDSTNNVVPWKDFSIGAKEAVRFDDGDKTKHNYLNVVTGANASAIQGAIEGGKDVYIVNPNGVLFGKGAIVNVGNLYVSTQDTTSAVNAFTTDGKTGVNVLAAGTANADVVNLGKLNATNVAISGKNITFTNASSTSFSAVTATGGDITLAATGTITNLGSLTATSGTTDGGKINLTASGDVVNLGTLKAGSDAVLSGKNINLWNDTDTGTSVVSNISAKNVTLTATDDVVNFGKIAAAKDSGTVTVKAGNNLKIMDAADVTGSAIRLTSTSGKIRLGQQAQHGKDKYTVTPPTYTTSGTVEYFGTIKDASDLAAVKDNLSGDFEMANDVTWNDGATNAPLGDNSTPFTGKFNGNYYAVNNISDSSHTYAGLFGYTDGATIQSVGVKGTGTIEANYAGGIVGYAKDTTLKNVYNDGIAVTSTLDSGREGGGIAGYTIGSTIDVAYNKATVNGRSGGIAGTINSTTISNVYSTGTSGFGIISRTDPALKKDTSSITNAYTTNTALASNDFANIDDSSSYRTSVVDNATFYKTSTYTTKTTIGDREQAFATGVISDSGSDDTPFRIYEGQSLPLLRAFLRRGRGTVTVNYDWNHGTNENGNAITGSNNGKDLEVAYNAQNLTLSNVTYGGYVDKSKIKEGTETLHDANVYTDDPDYDADGKELGTTSSSNGVTRFYTLQNGYDLVGEKVKITQREVDVQNALGDGKIQKTYDGTVNLSASDIKELLSGSSSSDSGLIKGDTTAELDASKLTATFDDENVGAGKTVTLNGGISLVNLGKHNYKLSNNSTSFNNEKKKGTINPRKLVVDLASAQASISKTYDGKADAGTVDASGFLFKDVNSEATTTYDKDNVVIKGGKKEDVKLGLMTNQKSYYGIYDATKKTFTQDADAADSKDVQYNGLYLTGDNAANYVLVDTKGNKVYGQKVNGAGEDVNLTTGGTIYGAGTINKRIIDTSVFTVKDAQGNTAAPTKVYDGNATYTLPDGSTLVQGTSSIADSGVVNGEKITFSIANGNAYFTDASGKATSQVANATNAAIGITATAGTGTNGKLTKLSNYAWGTPTTPGATTGTMGSALSVQPTTSITTKGLITPRDITVQVTQPSTVSIDKTYDGTTVVNYTNYPGANIFGTSGYVDYTSGSLKLADGTNGTTADGTSFKVTAAYDNKNVNRDAQNNVVARNIDYTVQIDGANAANYTLNGTQLTSGANSITILGSNSGAKGIINPKNLSSSFTKVTKTYDGTTNVPTGVIGTTALTTSNGLVSGDTVNLTVGNAAYQSKNVNGDDTTKVINNVTQKNWVNYSGLSLSGANAGNYTITSTAVGEGAIDPLTLNAGDFTYKIGSLTKEYDGDKTITPVDAAAGLTSVTVTKTGDVFKGTRGTQTVDYTKNVSATYTSSDSNNQTAQDVNYTVTVVDDGTGNYVMNPSSGITEKVTGKDAGVITPRIIEAHIVDSDLTKTYDADSTATADASKGNKYLISYTYAGSNPNATAGLVGSDTDASTGVYVTKGTPKADADASAVKGKEVLYTLKTSAKDQSNYEIVSVSKNGTTTTTTPITTLTGDGTINKRGLKVTFNNVTKSYDGTGAVTDAMITGALGLDDGTTGNAVITKDGLLKDFNTATTGSTQKPIQGAYQDSTNQFNAQNGYTVAYSNLLAALGTHAKNYNISNLSNTANNGTIYGTGDITKLALNGNFVFDFNTISKEYDGNANVAHTDVNGNNVTAESYINNAYVNNNGTQIKLSNIKATKATYASANSNNSSTPQTVTYDLTFGNLNLNNYIVANGTTWTNTNTANNTTTTLTYNNGAFKATTTGTITPRKVVASVVNHNLTKTYDGTTTAQKNGTTPFISYEHYVGPNKTGGAGSGLVASDVDASTGVYGATADASQTTGDKTVTYTLGINNASNYEIVDGATGSVVQKTLQDKGTIDKRKVLISFTDTRKTWDGTTAATGDLLAPTVTFDDSNKAGNTDGKSGIITNAALGAAAAFQNNLATDPGKYGTYSQTNVTQNGQADTVTYNLAELFRTYDASGNLINDYGKNYDFSAVGNNTGKGYIDQLVITNPNAFHFNFNPITKEYDNTYNVGYTDRTTGKAVTAASFVKDSYVTVNGKNINLGGWTATGTYQSKDSSNKAQPVTYTVNFGSNAGSNFTLGSFTRNGQNTAADPTLKYSNGVLTATTEGTITPRTVYASLKNSPTQVTKTYNGLTDILQNGSSQNIMGDVQMNGLLTGTANDDGVRLNTAASQAQYKDKNAGSNKDIIYNLSLTGTNASQNYKIVDANQPTKVITSLTSTGTGNIDKAHLSIDVGRVEKVYDTSADVTTTSPGSMSGGATQKTTTTIAPTLFGFVAADKTPSLAMSSTGITGEYATWDTKNNTAVADANVNRDTSGNVIDKGVQYKNIAQAFNSMAGSAQYQSLLQNYDLTGGYIAPGSASGASAKVLSANNGIADTVYFNEAAAKGQIKPLALTQGALIDQWNRPITKVYDGTADVKNPTQYMTLYVADPTNTSQPLTINGKTFAVGYTLAQNGAIYKDASGNAQINQTGNTPVSVEYSVNGLSKTSLNNFSTPLTFQNTYTSMAIGNITPRTIYGTVTKKTDVNKTYDSTKNLDAAGLANLAVTHSETDANGNTVTNATGDGILAKDAALGVTLTKSGSYDNADATIKPGAQATNARNINYTMTLNDPTGLGNYVLDPNYPNGYTATGDIYRAKIKVHSDAKTSTEGSTPSGFTGKTTGWYNDADHTAYLSNGGDSNITWNIKPGQDATKRGTYGIYGWYLGTTFPVQQVSQTTDPTTGAVLTTTETITNPVTNVVITRVTDAKTGLVTYQDAAGKALPASSVIGWFNFSNDPTKTSDPDWASSGLASYALVGSQRNGLYGTNYYFEQDPSDLTVNAVSHGGGGGGGTVIPSKPVTPVTPVTPVSPVTPTNPTTPTNPSSPITPSSVPDVSSDVNAAKQFVPNANAYNNASQDDFGSVTRSGQAGLEYASGGINVLGETGTPDVKVSSADNAAIGLQNAGSVVNLSGGDAMEVSASRVDLTGGDSFTITGDTEVVRDSSAAIESAGAQTYEGSAAVETADAGTYDGSAAVESAGARTDLQSTTDASWLFGDEASASERQSGTSSSSSSSSEDEGTSLFSRSYDDDETAARSAISVMTADDTESAEDTEDAKDKDKDEESKDAESSDAADDSSIGIESEGSGVNVAS